MALSFGYAVSSDFEIESAIGLHDVALSYASDGSRMAAVVDNYSAAYELRCYSYTRYRIDQLGLNIFDVMRFVYLRTSRLVVINSPNYRLTAATEFEFNLISRSLLGPSVFVVEAGGSKLVLPETARVRVCVDFCDSELIGVMSDWKRSRKSQLD